MLWAMMTTFLLNSCTRKIAFLTSSASPAARGNVRVKKDKNHNYVIKIDLMYLAEIKRMEPPKHTYVVWLVTEDKANKNIGQLNSSIGTFSKKLKASMETVSAVKPTRIFITAEDDGTVQNPGAQVITTKNF